MGLLLGSLFSSQILNYMSTVGVFWICGGMCLLSLLYVLVYIEESVRVQESQVSERKVIETINYKADPFVSISVQDSGALPD